MATAIQRRRGNTAQHASFTGLAGEITIDTDKNTVVVHDGVTAGGYPLARADEVEALGGADITAVIAGSGLTGGAVSGNATINIGAGAGITVNADNVAVNTSYYDVTAGGTGWTGNLEPSANNTYSLGSPTKVWKDVYVGPNSLVIDGVELGITNGVLQFGGANVAVAGSASSNADTRALFSAVDAGGDGSFSYNSATGAFTYTGPSASDVRAHFSAGSGITITSGAIAVDSTIATKEYANTAASAAVASVIDAAPATLDTLNELAAALGDDANFSTTITNSISSKLSTADFNSTANTWIGTQSTTALAEGTNLYFTAARARGNISVTDNGGDGSLSYDSGTGVISYTGPSASEVRAHFSAGTGITITNGAIATTITQYTDADARGAISVSGDLSYNSATGVISFTNDAGDIEGVTAGSGLTGGGTTGTVTLNIGAGTGITVNADDVAVNATYIKNLFSASDAGGDGSFSYSDGVFTYTGPSATEVRAHLAGGSGLTYTSGTFAVGAGDGITVNADDIAVNVSYIKGLFSASDAGGDGSFSYDNGVFTYTGPSATEVRAHLAGGAGLTYTTGTFAVGAGTGITVNADDVAVNAAYIKSLFSASDAGGDGSFGYSDGVFTYTGPSASEVRAHFSAGTGVTLSSGQISIGQAVGTTSNVTFNDVTVNGTLNSDDITASNITVAGNLTVTGTTTTVNTETINLADNKIVLNSNYTGSSPSEDGGIEIERGTQANKSLVWDETNDKWTVGSETFVAGTFEGNLTGNVTGTVTGTVSSLSNHDTADLAEGTNLYFTAARARGNISVTDSGGDGSLSYDSGTGVITYTGPSQSEANARIDARLSGGTGITYTSGVIATTITQYTDTLARGAISVTDSGGDGSLSYNSGTGVITYTGPSQAEANTRIDARLSGGTGITYTSGVIATTITQYTDTLARGAISVTDAGGDGSLSYDSGTGVITYTGPSASEVRAHFSAGTGVTLSSGQISIGQAVGTTNNVTFNNVTASANFIGNLTGNVTGNLTGNAGTATALATARTIALSGDVTGSATFDGSANATITATIAANSVALGTDTTGNYVASVANGAYITGGAAGSEGAALTLAVDATTTATASKVAARDASGDLYANIFQGTASSARYADLAERYEADAILEPGTVVCFGGEKEITACDHENDHAVAGVVSTDPAYMMNSAAGNNDTHPYIALTGRVPVKVVGPVAKGDLLVASGVKGHAMANNNAKAGTIIGKAIGSSDSGEGVVEALINLM